jgi:hypothetical protein
VSFQVFKQSFHPGTLYDLKTTFHGIGPWLKVNYKLDLSIELTLQKCIILTFVTPIYVSLELKIINVFFSVNTQQMLSDWAPDVELPNF